MTTREQAIQLTKDNLHFVFGSTDASQRIQKLSELWVPSSEVLFIDPLGAFKSHQDIDGIIARLQQLYPGQVFSEIGDVDVLHPNGDMWVTRLKWGQGPPGGEFTLTGEDVVTIVGGKIKALYTVLDQKI